MEDDGSFLVADRGNSRVLRFREGVSEREWAGFGMFWDAFRGFWLVFLGSGLL